MSGQQTAYDAGYEAAKRAIADRTRQRKKEDLHWQRKDFMEFHSEWEQFLAGWMKAIREDKERQLSWDDFYSPGSD